MRLTPSRPLLLALTLLPLAACMQTQVPSLEPADVPATFTPRSEQTDASATPAWPAVDWWTNFGDAELTALIGQVQAGNLDLANTRRNL